MDVDNPRPKVMTNCQPLLSIIGKRNQSSDYWLRSRKPVLWDWVFGLGYLWLPALTSISIGATEDWIWIAFLSEPVVSCLSSMRLCTVQWFSSLEGVISRWHEIPNWWLGGKKFWICVDGVINLMPSCCGYIQWIHKLRERISFILGHIITVEEKKWVGGRR